jgi:hypothetical protein
LTRQQFEARIISKAWKDEAFRKRLLEDPKAVMAEELASLHEKANLPDNVKVTVVEETADQIYLVLPMSPADFHPDELNEEDLLAVAGGASTTTAQAVAVVNVGGPTLDVVQVVGGPTAVVVVGGPSAVVC